MFLRMVKRLAECSGNAVHGTRIGKNRVLIEFLSCVGTVRQYKRLSAGRRLKGGNWLLFDMAGKRENRCASVCCRQLGRAGSQAPNPTKSAIRGDRLRNRLPIVFLPG